MRFPSPTGKLGRAVATALLLFLCGAPGELTLISPARADAVTITRAMFADTVMLADLTPDALAVRLEIGGADLDRMLEGTSARLPSVDAIARIAPLIQADGQALHAANIHVEQGRRPVRDPLTGDIVQAGDTAPGSQPVAVATFVYRFARPEPAALLFAPAMEARAEADNLPALDIGFVVQHGGIPVNEYRYLNWPVTLVPDWQDGWYSRFDHPNFNRSFADPLNLFVYARTQDVRVEIVGRVRDLLDWSHQPATAPRAALPALRNWLAEQVDLRIDGAPARGAELNSFFLYRNPRGTQVIGPTQEIDMARAMFSLTLRYPVGTPPEDIRLRWRTVPEGLQRIPYALNDPAGPQYGTLPAEDPTLAWNRFVLDWPAPYRFDAIAAEQGFIAMAAGFFGLGTSAPLPSRSATRALLGNIYHAFNLLDEDAVYDGLSVSVAPPLLDDIYLKQRAVVLGSRQGKARAEVREVSVLSMAPGPDGPGPDTRWMDVSWEVDGQVAHWGHIHQRRNRYRASLLLREQQGNWFVSDMAFKEQERTQ